MSTCTIRDSLARRKATGTMPSGAEPSPQRDAPSPCRVFTVISRRAQGLCVGLRFPPPISLACPPSTSHAVPTSNSVDIPTLMRDLSNILQQIHCGGIFLNPAYKETPSGLLRLRQVTLCGDLDPALHPEFSLVLESVIHLRACGRVPYFKVVLMSNGAGLERQGVLESLSLMTPSDEIWVPLDAGSPSALLNTSPDRVRMGNRTGNLDSVLRLGKKHPLIVQGAFNYLKKRPPSDAQIEAFAQLLLDLKQAGAQISMVQIYSGEPSSLHSSVASSASHLPLKVLSQIAVRVRVVTGLPTRIY